MPEPTNEPFATIKINVSKISKTDLYHGKNGIYLDLALFEKPNEFSDGFVVQSLQKESRAAGKRGEILGNFTIKDTRPRQTTAPRSRPAPAAPPPPAQENTDIAKDDIPF